MTNEKALEMFRAGIEATECGVKKDLYQTAISALEKQIPKKIKIIGGDDLCPACNFNYGADAIRRTLFHWRKDFCERCGQRLDWSD